MGAMYRLKAYFGMVPAEELGEYTDGLERHAAARRAVREPVDEGWDEDRYARRDASDDRDARRGDRRDDGYDDEWDHRPSRPTIVDRTLASVREPFREPVRGPGPSAVRGSLAMDPDADQDYAQREPARSSERPPAVPEPREPARGQAALARITTLQPRSYNEARTIGERYRDGVPVIMNLTELDDAAAKRLVDFAAGLAFALRGSIDKVTSRVFLLTPADVEVSADDARKLAERGHFRQD
ncbi:MAG: cell division protein SepF [Pseudonocardia sp.]|nr:cell division protein SepF [Pseudonocardia sp.]